jgi:hypothetical protein
VLHAYGGEQGPLGVEVRLREREFEVRVLDGGIGMSARECRKEESEGIGLHVIRTLARTVEFDEPRSGGATVSMAFDAPGVVPLEPGRDVCDQPLKLAGSPSAAAVSIAPTELARTILPRLASALAARAHFTTDRISDVQLLADTLAARAPAALCGDRLDVEVEAEPRALELRLGPLDTGRARVLAGEPELDGVGRIIEKLTDRSEISTVGEYQALTLHLTDPR